MKKKDQMYIFTAAYTSANPGIAPNIALTLFVFISNPFNVKILSPKGKNYLCSNIFMI